MPLLVKKPISVLDKNVTIAWRDAFRTLGKSIIHLASGKIAELGTDLVELAGAVGLVHDQGEVAWLLIRRALMQALSELLRDHRDLFRVDPPDDQKLAAAEAGLDIEDQVLELDERFFRDPGALDLLETLRSPLAIWLETYGVRPTAARVIAERLRPYFVLALHDEWARAPSDYAKLREALDTPFTRAQDLERAWLRYEAHLWRVVNEPMFAEPFGLKTVYVPLRGFWERPADHAPANRGSDDMLSVAGDEKKIDRIVVDLKATLDCWLATNKKDDALRVLSGGPGSGKSSFTRMYAAETITTGRVHVLYVPLHLFDPKGDLISAVGDYVRTSRTLPSNPLDVASGDEPRRLLLIFDGLDELAMQGKLAAETAQQFVREVDKTLDKLNQMKPWLSVLISGRELVVQANRTEFRKRGQVLHLLPYAVDVDYGLGGAAARALGNGEGGPWEDPDKHLEYDQRTEWWRKYRDATGIEPESIPGQFLQGELGDVTRQPLLLYLVALSFARKRLTLGPETNLNDVYADLVDAVWERGYEGRRFLPIQNLTKEQFTKVLEEVGLAAWHDERRTTTAKAIREHFETTALKSILDTFQQGAESGVTRLLAAFYFRQHGESEGEKTFEFTHKSFGEYLAARRIVRMIKALDQAMTSHEEDSDQGKDTVSALATWAEVCGPAALDQYYVRFLDREIHRHPRPEDVVRWQRRLSDMLSTAAKTGIPMERVKPRLATFHEELRRARNAEEALFACAAACSDITRKTTNVLWPTLTAAGGWIRRLQGQRSGPPNVVALNSLRRLNLTDCFLDMLDLYGADLGGAQLTSVHLQYACVLHANLRGVDLVFAQLSSTNLTGASLMDANLERANLTRANLTRANLWFANLTGAILTGATLSGAILTGAILTGANLTGANLTGANLSKANLSEANLTGATLTGANLSEANLTGATLTSANLTGANFTGANLTDAHLTGATLTDANLTDATLTGATLTDANLTGATLSDATLTGATLTGANLSEATFIEANLK